MTIKKGDTISITYTGTFDDGTVFDTSDNHGPLEFEVGAGQLIPGFDNAVVGMSEGEEKKIHLDPKDAYGDYKEEYVKKIPRENFPKEQNPTVGMPLMLKAPNGMQFRAVVMEVTENEVTLNLNHPLAGKALNFAFKVVSVKAK